MVKQRWWFSVKAGVPGIGIRVERFKTREQALLHAAAVGGFVPVLDFPHGATACGDRALYRHYLRRSESTK